MLPPPAGKDSEQASWGFVWDMEQSLQVPDSGLGLAGSEALLWCLVSQCHAARQQLVARRPPSWDGGSLCNTGVCWLVEKEKPLVFFAHSVSAQE